MIKEIEKLYHIKNNFDKFYCGSIPLCAAENVISDFVKFPLSDTFQERYIMGSSYDYSKQDNFIGSEYILPYYDMINQLGKELFHAKYTDARTLTGMNAANLLVSALCKPGDNIMILGKEWGGHASMKPTFERLGANVYEAPYDINSYDFDYNELNKQIEEKNIKFLNIAPSDILYQHNFSMINSANCTILFDYSQLLGLIAAGIVDNPLDKLKNCVLYGGTHKTMPGPAHGIIMTNDDKLYRKIDIEINPKYLRNVHTHQVVSLLHSMIEMKYYGEEYQKNTVRIANLLGEHLEKLGFNVVKKNGIYTQTHQLFLEMNQNDMDVFAENALCEKITLNTKKKNLFHTYYGIRLGLQEISRYKWSDETIKIIAQILYNIKHENYDVVATKKLIAQMPEKVIYFTFTPDSYSCLVHGEK